MSDERDSCPCCGEPVASSLRVCPTCQESLLVDVVLAEPIAEPRARYGLAREISAFGPPALPFSTLQQSLGEPRPVLARDASRLAAQRLKERLAGLGLQAGLERASGEPSSPRSRRGLTMAGIGATVLLALLLGMRLRGGAGRSPAHRLPPPPAVQAQSPSWPGTLSQSELAALALPAVVSFLSADGHTTLGFLVAPGLALTRGTAISDGEDLKILAPEGGESAGEVVKRDDGVGLALVRVPGSQAGPLQLGDAASLRGGQQVFFAIPTEERPVLQAGLLGAGARRIQGIAHLAFESGPTIGDGGPVLDAQGRVVGLVAVQPDGAYLLPINYAYMESQLVEPPQPAPDPKKWQDLLAEVDAVERLRVGPDH
jgi:hypothetical protein